MPLVMARANWPGIFHRTLGRVVAPDGEVLDEGRRQAFPPGDPVEVTDDEYADLEANGDLGAALFPCSFDEKGRAKIDAEAFGPDVGGPLLRARTEGVDVGYQTPADDDETPPAATKAAKPKKPAATKPAKAKPAKAAKPKKPASAADAPPADAGDESVADAAERAADAAEG